MTRAQKGPGLREEARLIAAGYRCIAGVDEAGRGAWAGPVTAAAVVLPDHKSIARKLRGVDDSKRLRPDQRAQLRMRIEDAALAFCIGMASNDEIDQLGILPATRLAMMRAVAGLRMSPDALLIDAVRLPALALHQHAFNFADSISLSVAAASILAKTARDELMSELDAEAPAYRFGLHKGYGTAAHRAVLTVHGVSRHHRRSYRPIAAALARVAQVEPT
jgi:ribonuclease HII